MGVENQFPSRIVWTGNSGDGTRRYRGYDRTWDLAVPGKTVVHCSNDPALGGDSAKLNPEDLLVSSVSACHMLWYLHLANQAGIVVTAYEDAPVGFGESEADGSGRFVLIELRPEIVVKKGADLAKAEALHGEIHRYCFIARSLNFPVRWRCTLTEAD